MSCAAPRSRASSSSRRSCSSSTSRDLRIRRAVCLLDDWERSFWHWTTIPVGRCVIRTAESVLFTCCPPAPEARYVSIRRSLSSISTSTSSGSSGATITWANDVCRRRSEEHTSELQSHVNLVCRLLLEKKNNKKINDIIYQKKIKQILPTTL